MDGKNSNTNTSHNKRNLGKFFTHTLYDGLSTIAPFVGVVFIIVYCLKALSHIGQLLYQGATKVASLVDSTNEPFLPWISNVPSWISWLIPLSGLFTIGLLIQSRIGSAILKVFDKGFLYIPGIKFLYSSLKQFVQSIKGIGGEQKFKSVAYVEYPSPGCRLLGFVTGHYFDEITQKDVTTVFVPTSPNPATGFLLVVDNDKVMHSTLTLEEAGKLVLSAGLVHPSTEHSG